MHTLLILAIAIILALYTLLMCVCIVAGDADRAVERDRSLAQPDAVSGE